MHATETHRHTTQLNTLPLTQTFTLAGLLITGHDVGAMNIAVACYRDTQTHDTTEQCAFEESHIVGPAWTHTFNGSFVRDYPGEPVPER